MHACVCVCVSLFVCITWKWHGMVAPLRKRKPRMRKGPRQSPKQLLCLVFDFRPSTDTCKETPEGTEELRRTGARGPKEDSGSLWGRLQRHQTVWGLDWAGLCLGVLSRRECSVTTRACLLPRSPTWWSWTPPLWNCEPQIKPFIL